MSAGIVYINLDHWVRLAGRTLGLDEKTVRRVADLDSADSALHAPAAGFGDTDFYPDLTMKAAVLGWHLAKNHALPDGNKRTAFTTMVVFLRRNRATWHEPDEDDAVEVMLAVAAGNMDIDEFAIWVTAHTTLPST
jgi:death on curing protein